MIIVEANLNISDVISTTTKFVGEYHYAVLLLLFLWPRLLNSYSLMESLDTHSISIDSAEISLPLTPGIDTILSCRET